jgi:hypothetical protein
MKQYIIWICGILTGMLLLFVFDISVSLFTKIVMVVLTFIPLAVHGCILLIKRAFDQASIGD